ncbi:thioesterase domain-containing protein (plasmid) [Streptomyces sp. NBC_00441]|uniref:thioesterase domain-containing protein n=1 Tax=Streptomyces sp. NBC_00441 TaxID=2975742 RepID=UPI002E2D27FC|nr:thioesterase domain-containing protein [Streptomyces sp. NBC_00441]
MTAPTQRPTADRNVMLPLRRGGSGAPLFCVHPGSGFGLPYAGLLPHLDARVPVHAVQARGLVTADGLPSSLDEMAADYTEQIRRVQPAGPYRLLGWCVGGRLAFEIACRLRAQGEHVGLLALVSTSPPVTEPLPGPEEILRAMLLPPGADELDAGLAGLCRLPLDHASLSAHLVRTGHPMRRLTEPALTAVYEVYRTNEHLYRTPVSRVFDGDALSLEPSAPGGPARRSWQPFVGGRVLARSVDGRHTEMMEPGPARAVGAAVNEALGY